MNNDLADQCVCERVVFIQSISIALGIIEALPVVTDRSVRNQVNSIFNNCQ